MINSPCHVSNHLSFCSVADVIHLVLLWRLVPPSRVIAGGLLVLLQDFMIFMIANDLI